LVFKKLNKYTHFMVWCRLKEAFFLFFNLKFLFRLQLSGQTIFSLYQEVLQKAVKWNPVIKQPLPEVSRAPDVKIQKLRCCGSEISNSGQWPVQRSCS